ncbi:MAG TPA: hypothetical protein VME21_05095 [Steroidobacteraceae bacterium]|nr:hypothetical protein [Steroidobacteraceae bacterium]
MPGLLRAHALGAWQQMPRQGLDMAQAQGKDPVKGATDDVDTVRLPVLRRFGGATEITEAPPPVGTDPYSTEYLHPKTPRRSLDDMRKLSEEIKRARFEKKSSD